MGNDSKPAEVSASQARQQSSADLMAIIRRGKRLDAIFASVGALLIFGSLSVLGILIGDLFRDGAARLGAKTYVKEDGQAPGRRDVVGKLERTGAGSAAPGWRLVRQPIDLEIPKKVKTDLAPLVGQRVIVTGSLPAPDEPMEVEKVVRLPSADEKMPRIGRRDFVGVLARDEQTAGEPGRGWTFQPDTLALDITSVTTQVGAMEGETVAVTGAKSQGDASMVADSVERMIPKGFFNSMPSRKADRAGILSAWVGTIMVMFVTICTALPLGIAAGLYLEEYAPKNWFTALIEINIANLAGVPSIIWGLMALGLFIYQVGTGRSVLTAGLTLGLLVLPIVIIATREAIRAIPNGIRDASFALGATKWETVRHHVLPYSLGGILTGTIVSLSRAIGETAPLITIGALTYVAFLPESPVQGSPPFVNFEWLRSPFTVLPIQMFNWISRPDRAFHNNAAAAGLVLIVMTLGLNATAIYLRARLRKKINW